MNKPKPRVDVPPPTDIANYEDVIGRCRSMFDLMHLALQTDSTRIVTLQIHGAGGIPPEVKGAEVGYHGLSHHGQDPTRLAQLRILEKALMTTFAAFLAKLQGTNEDGANLLDRTSVLLGSALGNASSHDNHNLPILLAGGGFRHGQHLAFDPKKNAPLSNLFVSILQQMGLDDKFRSSTGTIKGLEPQRS